MARHVVVAAVPAWARDVLSTTELKRVGTQNTPAWGRSRREPSGFKTSDENPPSPLIIPRAPVRAMRARHRVELPRPGVRVGSAPLSAAAMAAAAAAVAYGAEDQLPVDESLG